MLIATALAKSGPGAHNFKVKLVSVDGETVVNSCVKSSELALNNSYSGVVTFLQDAKKNKNKH
jgi:hypothetical protein